MEGVAQQLVELINDVTSIQELHRIASAFPDDMIVLHQVYKRIVENEIKGDYDDYHNMAVIFARLGDYESTTTLIEKGLELFPENVDLLADFLEYGPKCGKGESCAKILPKLLEIPHKTWTPRGFRFCISYLCNNMNSKAEYKTTPSLAETLCSEFQAFYPEDEEAYLTEYDMLCAAGDRENAFVTLSSRIDAHVVMPRCCMRYCDLLLERGDYEAVIKYSAKAIMGDAQSQSGVRIGYLFYLSGLARDAIIWRDGLFNDREKVIEMYSDFLIAEELFGGNRASYSNQIMLRTTIMARKSGLPYKSSLSDATGEE